MRWHGQYYLFIMLDETYVVSILWLPEEFDDFLKKQQKKTKQPEENQLTEVLKIGHTRTSDRRQWSVKGVLTLSGSLYLFDFMFRIVFLLKLKGIPLLVPRAVDVE